MRSAIDEMCETRRELTLGAPRNYLTHVYRKPKHLVACIYAAQALLLGQGEFEVHPTPRDTSITDKTASNRPIVSSAAGNAYTAGRYFLRAGGDIDNEWGSRGIGVAVLVSALFIHGTFLKWGLRFLKSVARSRNQRPLS